MDDDREITSLAARVLNLCKERGVMLATAESCTGGLIGGALTAVAGSSAVVDRGFITYSNEAKSEMLGVPETVLRNHGAVSSQTAEAMAQGCLDRSRASLSFSVTGIAGPGGGSAEKPEGLVWFGQSYCHSVEQGVVTVSDECRFGAIGRGAVRRATILHALTWAARTLSQWPTAS